MALRGRYAMSGTDIASGAVCLRARYAMSGTDLAYGTRCPWQSWRGVIRSGPPLVQPQLETSDKCAQSVECNADSP
eukprot:722692-Rhodomonas_salina.2